jgi:hypothetical protein
MTEQYLVNGKHHPWRYLRSRPDVRVIFVELPDGVLGFCDHEKKTIWLTTGMRQRQRREVLQHELEHLDRGRVAGHFEREEERAVEAATAHALITLPELLTALRWSRDMHEVADELWVPVDLVAVRWNHLHPAETAAVKRVLADVEEMIAP